MSGIIDRLLGRPKELPSLEKRFFDMCTAHVPFAKNERFRDVPPSVALKPGYKWVFGLPRGWFAVPVEWKDPEVFDRSTGLPVVTPLIVFCHDWANEYWLFDVATGELLLNGYTSGDGKHIDAIERIGRKLGHDGAECFALPESAKHYGKLLDALRETTQWENPVLPAELVEAFVSKLEQGYRDTLTF